MALETAGKHEVPLGTVTDEILLLCGKDREAAPRPHWTPWLVRQSDEDAATARETTLRWLAVHGLAELDDGELRLAEPLSTLSWALASATGTVTYRCEDRHGLVETGGVFVLPEGLNLHDVLDRDAGLHHLTVRSDASAAATLAAALDPERCRRRTRPPTVLAGPEELGPALRELPGRVRSRSTVAAAWEGPDRPTTVITTVGTSRGLWVAQARGGPAAAATLQQVGRADVRALAVALLRPQPPVSSRCIPCIPVW